ncbi:glycosyltransferase [Micromonospora sp. NBS 11-29]|uniref:glycosyltransferase n=1 Tax=Micromonospora sp. NBS 11-29 TaxID=1960879 RepID=UPI000B78CCDC|nr:glycosyltransferase [Micromonospora sp. NBS 11-29]
MKIVFASLPGYGHTFPLLPLALAGRAAGHDVVYATGPRFHPLLRGLGFRVVPAGMPIPEAFDAAAGGKGGRTGELSFPEWLDRAVRAFHDVLPRRVAADLLSVLRAEQPDLVVYELGNPGAGLAARRTGVPALCHSCGRAGMVDRDDRWRREGGELLRAVAAEIGVTLPAGHLLGDPYLDIYPPSLQDPSFLATAERVLLRPVTFSEPGRLPEIAVAERRRPLVYLTLGTVAGTVAGLRAAVDGLSALDVDVVAAGPGIAVADLGPLPGNVHFERWVPQGELLPLVDLAVHHGGAGTMLGAAGAGVPQLLLPVGFDGFLNADAVSAVGAGRWLLPEGVERVEDRGGGSAVVSAEAIAAAAGDLLADPVAGQAAKTLAEEIAGMPGPTETAARFPEFVDAFPGLPPSYEEVSS